MTGCLNAERLLAQRASGLVEAERIRLEEHLGGCAPCREQARLLDLAGELLSPGFELDARTRQRAIDRALDAAASEPAPVQSRSRLWIALAAAAAAVLAVWGLGKLPETEARMAAMPTPELSPRSWELEGRIEARERARSIQLGRARATLAAQTVAVWEPAIETLRLERGEVELEVAHRANRVFTVLTRELRVEVIGTKLTVAESEVSVVTGRVRVTRLADGTVREIVAGERFEIEAPETAARPAAGPKLDVPALLASARREIARGNVDRARADLGRVLAQKPSAAERAEAQSLLAECSLVAGDSRSAQKGYAEVARKNAGTPAGETAAYAAARLEKDPARARALLEDYLRRYPKGRFRGEVQARLRALPR